MRPPEQHQDKRLHWILIGELENDPNWAMEIWEWQSPVWRTPTQGASVPPHNVEELAKKLAENISYWNPVEFWLRDYSTGGVVHSAAVASEIHSRDAEIAKLTARLAELEN